MNYEDTIENVRITINKNDNLTYKSILNKDVCIIFSIVLILIQVFIVLIELYPLYSIPNPIFCLYTKIIFTFTNQIMIIEILILHYKKLTYFTDISYNLIFIHIISSICLLLVITKVIISNIILLVISFISLILTSKNYIMNKKLNISKNIYYLLSLDLYLSIIVFFNRLNCCYPFTDQNKNLYLLIALCLALININFIVLKNRVLPPLLLLYQFYFSELNKIFNEKLCLVVNISCTLYFLLKLLKKS